MHAMNHKRLLAMTTLLTLVTTAHAGISISFDPSDTTVGVGEFFTVDILADIPTADAIVGWGMDVGFDSFILGHNALTDVAIDPAFTALPTLDGDFLAAGLGPSFPPAPPVSGTNVRLATLTFEALSVGITTLNGGFTTTDATEGFVQTGGRTITDVAFGAANINVVPAPHAMLIGTIGLAMMLVYSRTTA